MGNGIIRYLVDCVFSVLYSSEDCKCLVCSDYTMDDEGLCNKCNSEVKYCSEKFALFRENLAINCFSAAYYTSVVKELIRRLKYKNDFLSGEFLAQLLIKTINIQNISFDVITFVPMTSKALKKRGYNQSKFLSEIVAKNFNKPSLELLIKKVETKDQIGLDGESRWENLHDCFGAINVHLVANKKILLIDDVITTGATAFLSSKALLLEGAEEVTILTIAKSQL